MIKILPRYIVSILVLLPLAPHAQTESTAISPTVELIASQLDHPVAFGIFIDRTTYEQTQESVHRYRNVLEAEGLAVSIVQGIFQTPADVKAEIQKLYQSSKPLEGILLIGKIPKPYLLIDGKFLQSDRYYDDMSLEFESLMAPEMEASNSTDSPASWDPPHRYKLSGPASTRPLPSFYSARIPYIASLGEDATAAIGRFLDIAAATRHNGFLDHIATYSGPPRTTELPGSTEPDCLIAWRDRDQLYREFFPRAFRSGGSARVLHYRMAPTTESALIATELNRAELDLFLLSRFDSWENLASEINPERQRARNSDGARILLLDGADIGAMNPVTVDLGHVARLLYNADGLNEKVLAVSGNFHSDPTHKDSTAEGKIATLTGILERGARLGHLQRMHASWTNQLVGDPTFRFDSEDGKNDWINDLTIQLDNKDLWLAWLAHGRSTEDPTLQSLALRMLADQDQRRGGVPPVGPIAARTIPDELYDAFTSSPYYSVRLQALTLLTRYPGEQFTAAVRAGLLDPSETVSRLASRYVGAIGDPALLPAIIEAMVFHAERQRVVFHLRNALKSFPPVEAVNVFTTMVGASNRLTKKEEIEKFRGEMAEVERELENNSDLRTTLHHHQPHPGHPHHAHIEEYLRILSDRNEELSVRIAVAEILGSFRYSYKRVQILNGLKSVLKERRLPAKLRAAVESSLQRIQLIA